ncbi:MAG: hypothetical protein K8L91_17830 [Anaerolineae bacterium]|nr:hypothetical protein [Anaerolineae bacterium]
MKTMFANRKSLWSVFGLLIVLVVGLLFVGAVKFDFPMSVLAQDEGCEDEDETGDDDDADEDEDEDDEDCEDEAGEDDAAEDEVYSPNIDPANFVQGVDNPYFPLVPGTAWVYEGETEDGLERIEVKVLDETRVVMGITCVIVQDTVWLDGEMIEDTFDWYAQDKDGNVWYMGEDTHEYENGVAVNSNGAWEAGVDGALPGIVMQAQPEIGESYRQEYYVGEAEDMAEVISLTESVTIAYGSFENVLVTKEWTPLEPGKAENKYYAAGVGLMLEEVVEGGEGRIELIEVIAPNTN